MELGWDAQGERRSIIPRVRTPRGHTLFSEKQKKVHYIVFHAATGYWPEWPAEVIHHIDGNTLNNELSNLRLMSNREHSIEHNIGENNHFFGKHHSKEARARIGAANSGEGNGRWQGDDASPTAKYAREWYAKRGNV